MTAQRIGNLAVWHFPAQAGSKARARVLLVHGLGEHAGRHRPTIDYLNGHGIEVVAFDLRGAGQSEGIRQYVDAFDDYLADVQTVRDWLERTLPPLPLFLFGHSLGGTISIRYAARSQAGLRGLILSAPGFEIGDGISPVKIAVGRMLGRFFPKLRIPGALDLTALSRIPEEIEIYKKDPLNCTFNTTRQGKEILNVLELLPQDCARITIPTLIVHGGADRLVPLSGSKKLIVSLASQDKELEILPAAYHEMHHDLDRAVFFEKITGWVESHR